MRSIRIAYDVLFMLGGAGYLLHLGYRRRRVYWSRGSWLRFGVVCGVGLVMLGVGLGMSSAIGHGASPAWVTNANRRAYWILVSGALLLSGVGVVTMVLCWLAMGEPMRPFPGASGEPARQLAIGADWPD